MLFMCALVTYAFWVYVCSCLSVICLWQICACMHACVCCFDFKLRSMGFLATEEQPADLLWLASHLCHIAFFLEPPSFDFLLLAISVSMNNTVFLHSKWIVLYLPNKCFTALIYRSQHCNRDEKKTVDSQQSLHTCSVYAQVQIIHSKGRQILSHKGFIQYLIDCEGR